METKSPENAGVPVDTTTVSNSFPVMPAQQVIRNNILSALDEMFASGLQVLTVEGVEEVGKTTLLAQFAKRHAQYSVNVFVKSTSLLAYDPQLLLRDICNQIHFILHGDELPDDAEVDESVYRDLIFALQRLSRRRNIDIFFVVDGLEEIEDKSHAQASIIALLPVGLTGMKLLVSAKPETLFRHLPAAVKHKSFVLVGFSWEETIAYFADLRVDRKFVDELFQLFSRGIPGQMASVRRLLESGVPSESLLNELADKAPDLFELEWKAVDAGDDNLLNALSLISQSAQKLSISDVGLILKQSDDLIRTILSSLTFVRHATTDSEPVEFVSDRFRRFVSTRLTSRRSLVRGLAIECFLQTPESDKALSMLPTYLEEAGQLEDLLVYLSPEHLTKMVERSGSLLPVQEKTTLGLSTALCLGRDGDLLRFGIQRSALTEFDRYPTLRSEVKAWIALGEYANAVRVAQAAMLKGERLRLLAAIARFQKERGMTPERELVEQIGVLAEQISPKELGDAVVELASDLMYSRPDLGIGLVDKMSTPSEGKESVSHDWALAFLSVDTLVNAQRYNVGLSSTSEDIRQRIHDPAASRFSTAISFLFGRYSVADILVEAQKVPNLLERLSLLRLWTSHTQDKSKSGEIVEYGLRLSINTAEYTPTAKHLRELATPLPFIEDLERLGKLIASFDTQKGVVQIKGPTQDYVQLQLILAQAEARINPDAAGKRLQEIYFDIDKIKDLELKTSCMARLTAALPRIDPAGSLKDAQIITVIVEEEFDRQLTELLAASAEHDKVTKHIIEVLAISQPELARKIATSLNVEPRRDQALLDLVDACLVQALREIPFAFLERTIADIQDADLRDQAIAHILKRVTESTDATIQACLPELLPSINTACQILDVELRCKACGHSVNILERAGRDKYESLLGMVLTTLSSSWESMDGGIDKVDTAYELASELATYERDRAWEYLNKAQGLRKDPQLDCARGTYISCLRLAVRTFSGLLLAKLDRKEDLDNVASAINRVPSLKLRVQAWKDVALRFAKAERSDDCRRIVNDQIKPLLEMLKGQNESEWMRAVTAASPALYQAHPPTAIEAINTLPPQWKDVSIDLIVRFMFRKLPQGEPYENPEGRCNLEHSTAIDICALLQLVDTDSLLYLHIETLVESAIWKHNETPFTQEQRNDLAQRLTTLIAAKLPNPRYIVHSGFAIIARAQVMRLSRHRQQWEDLIAEGRLIPNVSDRGYVLTSLADALPNDLRERKIELLNEAGHLADSMPSLADKVSRLRMLAESALGIDKPLAKSFLSQAAESFGKTDYDDDDDENSTRREIVDLAYRIDPELASSLASSMDDDNARQVARARIRVQELRSDLVNKQDFQPSGSDAEFGQLAQAIWIMLGQLNANRIETRHMRSIREWVQLASAQPLRKAYPVFAWVIENVISRRAQAEEARRLVRELYEASILGCDLISAVASRHYGTISPAKKEVLVDQPSRLIIHAGERVKTLQFLRDWLEMHANDCLKICDPYFGLRDLELLTLVLAVAPALQVTILTSKKQQDDDGVKGEWQKTYIEYWHQHFSDQEPPPTEIGVIGIQRTGEFPVHDRWWLTTGAGIRLGTSFNGLGIGKDSEISALTAEEVVERNFETEQYLQRTKREHLGQKLSFTFFSL